MRIDIIICLVLYICFFTGLLLLFSRPFSNIIARLSLRYRLYDKGEKKESILFSLLSKLVYASYGKENKGKVLFCILSLLFSFSFSFSFIYFNFVGSFLIAILCTSVPIITLVSIIYKKRNRGSKESIVFINELYREYKIEKNNIYSAIENTVSDTSNYPICGEQLYKLLLRIRSSGSKNQQERYCDEFAFALGSVWAKSISKCILLACDGVDISDALLDILSQMKISKQNLEEKKRLNSESSRMSLFLVPILYLSSFIFGSKWLGIPVGQLIYNQFCTAAGLLFFLFIALLFFFNLIIIEIVSNERIDI